jgi:hypothetical protein
MNITPTALAFLCRTGDFLTVAPMLAARMKSSLSMAMQSLCHKVNHAVPLEHHFILKLSRLIHGYARHPAFNPRNKKSLTFAFVPARPQCLNSCDPL